MKQIFTVRTAMIDDLKDVERVLLENDLQVEGLEEQWGESYCVTEYQGKIIGVSGVEIYGGFGLLRSVAVIPTWKGKGVGEAMVKNRVVWAKLKGLSNIFLLTIDAEVYFARFGFTPVDRKSIPAEIKKSLEFSTLCPESAVAMVHSLSESSPDSRRMSKDEK